MFTDSTNQGSDKDSAFVMVTIPFAADSVDSIIFVYKGDTGGEIDSLYLFGPDRSTGTNMADSQYYSANVSLTSTSWSREEYFVGDSMDCVNAKAGDNWVFKFFSDLADDDDWIKVSWVQIRAKR
jgi:hypothetical protein